MASGKSTLGKTLAEALPGRTFIDLDDVVETRLGMSIPECFSIHGEAYFRRVESEVLRELSIEGAIVACGGGTPCYGTNADYMLGNGFTVLLEASPEVTARRLRLAPGQRPLVDALPNCPGVLENFIISKLAERSEAYSRCHVRFDANELEDEEQIARSVQRFKDTFQDYIN